MSNTDSFIDEVNEEVRRDRMNLLLRRYGWIPALIVVVAVGGTAWNEWRNAKARAEAEALGDSLMAALESDGPEAVGAVEAEGDAALLVDLIAASQMEEGAAEALERAAATPEGSVLLRELAALGAVMAQGPDVPANERLAALEPLTTPGAPYRLMALEQQALIRAETGETGAAIGTLREIISDAGVTAGLRLRATQLIVALGGDLEAE